MKTLFRFLSLTLIILWFGDQQLHEITAQPQYRYAYLIAESPTRAQIGIIDPADIGSMPDFRDLPLPADWRPPAVRNVSPSGDWAVFVSALQTDAPTEIRHVRLYNFVTGETRNLELGYLFNALDAPEQSIAWSPDHHYVAFNVTQDRLQHDVIVYSLQDGSTNNVTTDAADQRGIVWSPDSTHIATFSTSCPNIENCSQAIEVINISSQERQLSPNLREFAPNTLGVSCGLQWSPDGIRISFMAGCDQSPSIEREVFIYDVVQSTLNQVTTFTSETFQPGRFQFAQAQYTMSWLDPSSLLIGATYQTDPNGQQTRQSLVYKVLDDRLISLFDQYAEQWAINPATSQIAARLISSPPSPQGAVAGANGTVLVFSLQDSTAGDLNASVNAGTSLPLGCDLAWSPNGSTLAYTIGEGIECIGAAQRLVFVDSTTLTTQEYTPQLENGAAPFAIVPVGWVAS